jgi:uncharacterized delta-60 repeat protein
VALPDDRILLGGGFAVGSTPRNQSLNLVRLLANGAPDPAFNGAPKVNDLVEALAVQTDGRVLIAGAFSSVNSVPRVCLARLNANGALDTQFDVSAAVAQSSTGASSRVRSVWVQPGGAIVVAGLFRTAGSEGRWSVGRLNPDGSRDPTFQLVPGGLTLSGAALAPADPDHMWVGNAVPLQDGAASSMLARLGSNGVVETAFNITVERPGYGSVVPSRIIPLPDGRMVVAGLFTTIAGQLRPGLARLIADERPRIETISRLDNTTALAFATISDPTATYRVRHATPDDLGLPRASWATLPATAPADGARHAIADPTQSPNRIYSIELVR